MINIRQFIDFTILGRHRLDSIEKLPLGSTLKQAVALYGTPIETAPSDEAPEVTQHIFAAGDYHEVVVSEWQGTIQSITYWSAKSDPGRDLGCMFDAYGESVEWQTREEGYWYQRKDDVVKLWCSAAPAIGVAFVKFLRAESELKIAHEFSKLNDLEDVTWAPDDFIHELQKRYVEEGDNALMEFAERSESIAVSRNGQIVLIVRDHHAYDVDSGFKEINSIPDPETGYASPVVNVFSHGEDGSSWMKIPLPRNAKVDHLEFKDDRCLVNIHQVDGGLRLRFDGPISTITNLGISMITPGAHTDEGLWKILQEAESEQKLEDQTESSSGHDE